MNSQGGEGMEFCASDRKLIKMKKREPAAGQGQVSLAAKQGYFSWLSHDVWGQQRISSKGFGEGPLGNSPQD